MLDNGDPHTEISLAKVLCRLGSIYLRGGALEKARTVLERSWHLYSRHAVLPVPGRGLDPRLPLGYTYIFLGSNISTAEKLGQDALQDHTLREDGFNLARTYYLLAMVTRVQGRYEASRHYAQQGYACTVATGDAFIGSYCLQEWGAASQFLGDTTDAKRRIQASYAIQKDFGDPKGMADTLIRLGRIALLEGDNAEARQCYEQARTLYHDLGSKVGLARSVEGMGNSARAMGHYGEARRYLREGIQVTNGQMLPIIPSIFVGIGELFLHTGKQARGIELLALALHHPVADQDTKDRAQHLLTRYQAQVGETQQALKQEDFEAVTTALLDELEIPEVSTLTRHTPYTAETLIEPLSERELAVLSLIADGLSNREIADKLFLSVATVKWYITHIFSKLSVQSRTLAIVRARQLNILT